MSTPSIQTLITQAQQVLNLKSSNEIRATLAAVLANANVGTPLNPNLTTQQLWDEFYEIVRQPSDDIMSIITDQMMRMVFSPPAPGGAGADKQVIFNDGGVLAGDPDLIFNKALNKLVANNIETAAGLLVGTSATITGDLTVATDAFKVISATKDVCIGTVTPTFNNKLTVVGGGGGDAFITSGNGTRTGYIGTDGTTVIMGGYSNHTLRIQANDLPQMQIAPLGVFEWFDGAGGTRMTLNSTGLGIGDAPASGEKLTVLGSIYLKTANKLKLDNASNNFGASIHNIGASAQAALAFTLGATQAMTLDASGNLLVGAASNPNTARVYFRYDTLTTQPVINSASIVAASTAWNHLVGQSGNGSTVTTNNIFIRGNGDIVNANGVYGTISDLRLKENISDARNYLADLLKLRVVNYSLKEEASAVANKLGFIAQEVEQVFPKMVDTDKEDTKSIKISVLIPMLVKAIQELTARVQTLEAK